jgi:tight adherence protein C
LIDQLTDVLLSVPGAVGEVFLPLVWGLPWAAGLFLAALPALIVQSARKRRVTAVEQDLPIMLDLLSALAEAGLGFDAALDRILDAEPQQRPLVQEFRLFQTDVLAGRGRVVALRQLGRRVDVTWFSILVAALVHAEQVGSGLSETLKIQAEDLRQRRRERALAFAMAIPVRLLPALVICFLPGLMVAAIAPVGYQIVQVLDQFIQQPFGG